ncbi:17491_t:CDS:2 [Gigaspora margarita]|uniref:17491_t:CDS:1 n=1 Tax=Gigaspora margarita TaxID=4874 RepID=A0ABN7URR3_GIGMA|nr:17491_t:CDS:2 [Gigaspora margarita]
MKNFGIRTEKEETIGQQKSADMDLDDEKKEQDKEETLKKNENNLPTIKNQLRLIIEAKLEIGAEKDKANISKYQKAHMIDYAKEICVKKDKHDVPKDYKESTELSLANEVKNSEHGDKEGLRKAHECWIEKASEFKRIFYEGIKAL